MRRGFQALRSDKKAFLFLALGITLIVVNAILIKDNWELRSYLNQRRESAELNSGDAVSSLQGVDINGNNLEITYDQDPRKTIILVFSPKCDYCAQNMPMWQKIITGVDKNSFRIVAVSLVPEGTKEYVLTYDLTSVPVIAKLFMRGANTYKLGLTPETILVSRDGKVEKVWKGLLGVAARTEIEQVLGVRLSA